VCGSSYIITWLEIAQSGLQRYGCRRSEAWSHFPSPLGQNQGWNDPGALATQLLGSGILDLTVEKAPFV
jgi:hypothetical protein